LPQPGQVRAQLILCRSYIIEGLVVSPNELDMKEKKAFLSSIPEDSYFWRLEKTKGVVNRLKAEVK
jgi:hypothetical protein